MTSVPLLEVARLVPERAQRWAGVRGYVATGDADDAQNLTPISIAYDERPTRADLVVSPGDVLMARMAGTQKVFEIDRESAKHVYSTGFVALRSEATKLVPSYLRHWLSTKRFQSAKDRVSSGATQRAVTNAGLKQLTIPLPSVAEQRRIAAILDHADALRAKRRQVLDLLDAGAGAIFVEMFGHPLRGAKHLQRRKLAELGQLDRGVSRHRPRNDPALLGGPYPLIQTGDVARSDGYIRRFKSTYSERGLAQSKLWPSGTLCITIAATIARSGILTFDACFPDSVVGFSAEENTVIYVQVWLGFLQAELEASAPQSAQKNINLAVLRELEVPVPSAKLLEEFAHRVKQVRVLSELQHDAQSAEEALLSGLHVRAFKGGL